MTPRRWRPPHPGRRPPAWWPANEPWPPRPRGFDRHARRGHAVWRAWAGWWLVVGSIWGVVFVLQRLAAIVRSGAPSWAAVPLGVAALGFVVATFVVTRRIGGPVADLVAAADRVSNRDYDVRVPERGPGPVRTVARAFNDMAARLARQEVVRRQLMADVAHELRTPLTVMQGRLEGLIDGVYARDDVEIERILADTKVLARLVEDLRTLAHAESGTLTLHREATDLGSWLADAVEAIRPEVRSRDVSIDLSMATDLPTCEVDPVRLREVVTNLLTNAGRHSAPGGRIRVVARATPPARVTIEVSDDGAGIPPEDLPRIFDRFHKGRDSTGSGLGLTIARGLVEAHGGTLLASSAVGQGTTMTIDLPVPE